MRDSREWAIDGPGGRRDELSCRLGSVADRGVVREFHLDEGWGVIDGSAVPGGCWVHFSAIAMDGFRHLAAGQRVWFRAEAVEQDGFEFRAVKVWTEDVEPAGPPGPQRFPADAYHSGLEISFDQPDVAGGE